MSFPFILDSLRYLFIFARICIETMSEKATYDIVRTESLVPKNIIESYVLSEARYNLGIYAQRLLYRLGDCGRDFRIRVKIL